MPTIRDTDKEAITACKRWCTVNHVPYDMKAVFAFAAWLGDPPLKNEKGSYLRDKIIDMDNPEISQKIKMINNSPYWYALIKVLEIVK